MNFAKVTKYMNGLDVVGETSAETFDALLIGSSIAITVDNYSDKTYVMVERVGAIDGELRVCDGKEGHLYDINLNGTHTVEDLASMSAIDYILACIQ